MSDRVAVMNAGRIDQIGTPQAIYESPATVFVADFLGVSNLMDARAEASTGPGCVIRIGDFTLRAHAGDVGARGAVKVVARPERLRLMALDESERDNCLPAMVERTVYVGANVQVIVRLPTGATMQASVANTGASEPYRQGTPVLVHVPPDALRVLAGAAAALEEDAAERAPAA